MQHRRFDVDGQGEGGQGYERRISGAAYPLPEGEAPATQPNRGRVDEKPGRRELIGGLAMIVGGVLGFWAYYPEDLDKSGRGIPMGLALPLLVVLGLWLVWRGWRRR